MAIPPDVAESVLMLNKLVKAALYETKPPISMLKTGEEADVTITDAGQRQFAVKVVVTSTSTSLNTTEYSVRIPNSGLMMLKSPVAVVQAVVKAVGLSAQEVGLPTAVLHTYLSTAHFRLMVEQWMLDHPPASPQERAARALAELL